MALRTKTIEFAFPYATASVATAVARDFTSMTVYIPETTSKTFRSVILEMSYVDNQNAAANQTAVLQGISLAAVARSDATVTQTITNSGENQSFIVTRDVTAYFTTNWTGTSMACGARLTVTGIATINATAKLIITYEYDDTSATTRIKTVKIPMDGSNGNMTGSLVNMGALANQYPNLDTFLPEASKVYRDIFFETYGHTNASSDSGGVIFNMRFDGTTTLASGIFEDQLLSDRWFKRIDKLLGSVTTSATHNVEVSVGNTSSNFPCTCGVLVVTYEYDHSASTRIINSIQLPALDEAGWVGGTALADESRYQRDIYIEEPGTITLVQSGVMLTFIDAGAVTLNFAVGGQAYRTYTQPASVRCGCMTITRRIDSGETGGIAGVTLARGKNQITYDFYTTSATAGNIGSNLTGLLLLNYTSDKATAGDGAHNHTTQWLSRPYSTGDLVQKISYTPTAVPNIPETDYWLTNSGFQINMLTSGTGAAALGLAYSGEIDAGESYAGGWVDFYTALYATDSEIGVSQIFFRTRSAFRRWPGDPDVERLNIETSRSLRFDCNVTAATCHAAIQFVTYHSITATIAGTISGSAGATVQIRAFSVSNDEEIGSTSRTGNGAYSLTWYDNTTAVYVVAYESTTLKGTSLQAVAGSTFDINLAGGGGGGPTYYAYI
jgi:hypothetical protein